jgi:hypothetical protein
MLIKSDNSYIENNNDFQPISCFQRHIEGTIKTGMYAVPAAPVRSEESRLCHRRRWSRYQQCYGVTRTHLCGRSTVACPQPAKHSLAGLHCTSSLATAGVARATIA